MKAVRYHGNGDVRVVDTEIRSPRNSEALIEVEACGVCGTDLHIIEGTSRSVPPVVLGHEYYGIIHEIGVDVEGFTPGLKVGVDPNIFCGSCYYCRQGLVHLCTDLSALGVDRDGGMAEFSLVPASQLYPVPGHFSRVQGVLLEPVSCILHGIDRAGIKRGNSVVIIGAGTIGLLMTALVRNSAADRIIVAEPDARKRKLAGHLGATAVIDPQNSEINAAVKDHLPNGADIVFECVGKPVTMRESLRCARRGGKIIFFGVCPRDITIEIEPYEIFANELTIMGSYINPFTYAVAIDTLERGVIDLRFFPVEEFRLSDFGSALESLRTGKTVKNIIVPDRTTI